MKPKQPDQMRVGKNPKSAGNLGRRHLVESIDIRKKLKGTKNGIRLIKNPRVKENAHLVRRRVAEELYKKRKQRQKQRKVSTTEIEKENKNITQKKIENRAK